MRREEWPRAFLSGRVLHLAWALIPSCSDPTSDGQISVFSVIPGSVMLTHTVLEGFITE